MGKVLGLVWLTSALVACGAAAPPPPPPPPPPAPPPHAEIRVASATCPDRPTTEARLAEVLVAHSAMDSDLIVEVSAEPGALQLLVLRSGGEVGLDRRYSLGPGDCDSAAELAALGVDRFLSSFPAWAGPAPRPETPPPVPPQRHRIDLALASSVHGLWAPAGLDVQLGVLGFRGALGGGALVRATVPQAAGSGRFQQTSLLGGVAGRLRFGGWELRGEVRAGALVVSGIGFDENHSGWLPWWEGALTGARRFGWGTVGLEVAATALQHRAITSDRLVAEDIPALRLGVAGTLGVFP